MRKVSLSLTFFIAAIMSSLICLSLAAPPSDAPQPAEPKKSSLYSNKYDFYFPLTFAEKSANELSWDESFLNIAHWEKMPAGNWRIESKTDSVIKYEARQSREFMGGPARLVKIRTDAKTKKILNIEVTWVNRGLTERFTMGQDPVTMSKREKREWLKDLQDEKKIRLEEQEKFNDEIEASVDELTLTLTKKFGEPKKVSVGRHRNFKVEALDFKTPTGTTLRLYIHDGKTNGTFGDEKAVRFLMATIYPSDVIQEDEYAVVPKANRIGRLQLAEANVVKSPNGDVLIKNVPMHDQGQTGGCAYASNAMMLEYYGSSLAWEVFSLRQREFNGTENANDQFYGAMADADIKIREGKFSLKTLMKEIDEGRPLNVSLDTRLERGNLRIEWKKQIEADPNFKLPEESRKERTDGPNRWTIRGEGGHATTITGYNKEKEIVFMTESSGEAHRNYPISFDELEHSATSMTTFTPEGPSLNKDGSRIAKSDPTKPNSP